MRFIVPYLLALSAPAASPEVVDALLATYRGAGAGAPDASRGERFWNAPHTVEGEQRACTTCHGPTLDAPGRHKTTGEPIAPMTAPERLTDPQEIEKWFGRNCRWTVGRACTPSEKADVLLFLSGGSR